MELNIDLIIEKRPSKIQVKELQILLKKEWDENKNGFYSNIFESRNRNSLKKLWLFYSHEILVGYTKIIFQKPIVEVVMFSIHYKKRGEGIGFLIYNLLEKELERIGIKAIRLNSIDSYSDKFWKKTGFSWPIPTPYSELDRTFVKIIKPILNPDKIKTSNTSFELWNVESHLQETNKPHWVWNIEHQKLNKKTRPIIQFCHGEWNFRVIENCKEIYNGKLKKFNKGNNHIFGFLFITKY